MVFCKKCIHYCEIADRNLSNYSTLRYKKSKFLKTPKSLDNTFFLSSPDFHSVTLDDSKYAVCSKNLSITKKIWNTPLESRECEDVSINGNITYCVNKNHDNQCSDFIENV